MCSLLGVRINIDLFLPALSIFTIFHLWYGINRWFCSDASQMDSPLLLKSTKGELFAAVIHSFWCEPFFFGFIVFDPASISRTLVKIKKILDIPTNVSKTPLPRISRRNPIRESQCLHFVSANIANMKIKMMKDVGRHQCGSNQGAIAYILAEINKISSDIQRSYARGKLFFFRLFTNKVHPVPNNVAVSTVGESQGEQTLQIFGYPKNRTWISITKN